MPENRLRDAYRSGETVWALLLLLIGATLIFEGTSMDVRQAHDPLGGQFFPILNPALLVLGAAAILLGPLARRGIGQEPHLPARPGAAPSISMTHAGEEPAGLLGRPLVRVAGMVGICVMYMLFLTYWTYIPGTILTMAATLRLLGVRRPRSLVVGPVITTVIIWFILTNLLNVRLP